MLVIGAPDEELDPHQRPRDLLLVERDKDLYEQAVRRAESLPQRAEWMHSDHVEDRIQVVRDVLAGGDYDLAVDDLGNLSLGGRIGRGGRIRKALEPSGPGGIAAALLEVPDLTVLIVLDAVRLGTIPPGVVKGVAVGLLALGVVGVRAPASAAASGGSGSQTSISQTVDAYDDALSQAAQMAPSAEVAAAQENAAQVAQSDEDAATAEDGAASSEEEAASDEDAATSEEAAASDEDAATSADADADATTSPADLDPASVEPQKGKSADADDVEVADDLSSSDVEKAQDAAQDSKSDLEEAQDTFDDTQDEAVDAQKEAEDAADAAVDAQAELVTAEANYDEAIAASGPVIEDATGLTGALPGGATDEDLAAARSAESEALAAVDDATAQADEALDAYNDAAEEAVALNADLEQAAQDVTDAQTDYNQDQATADAYADAMADARVTPIAEGEYTPSAPYHEEGPMWSLGYHTGTDFACPIGTEVHAAASGTVIDVVHDDPSYGNRIVIEHPDGYESTYNHLSETDVQVGDEVTAGQVIGLSGDTGNVSGPHLHFEVAKGGDGWSDGSQFVDPVAWLNGEIG